MSALKAAIIDGTDKHWCDLLSANVYSAFHSYGVGKMSSNFCWGLTYNGLVSYPWGVNDSRPLNTTETGDKQQAVPMCHLAGLVKGFNFSYHCMIYSMGAGDRQDVIQRFAAKINLEAKQIF